MGYLGGKNDIFSHRDEPELSSSWQEGSKSRHTDFEHLFTTKLEKLKVEQRGTRDRSYIRASVRRLQARW